MPNTESQNFFPFKNPEAFFAKNHLLLEDDIYLFLDIETDGPCPGIHSMLSFAAIAFDCKNGIFDHFQVNLQAIAGHSKDPNTMAWWAKNKAAWDLNTKNPLPPAIAMQSFAQWLLKFNVQPVVISAPASFDFTYLHWYCYRFLDGKIPFFKFGMDLNSFVCALTGQSYKCSGRSNWPAQLEFKSECGNHDPLTDARLHCESFLHILRKLKICN